VILDDSPNQLELLIKSLKIREKILYKHHKDFEEVYYRLYSFYVENGEPLVFANDLPNRPFLYFRGCGKYV
jgi:hypothetical protein